MKAGKPIVLILCTGNSCRSQMAEGFLKSYSGDRYDVHSAGMEPQPKVHPMAVKVMNEVQIDISGNKPKSLTEYPGRSPVMHLVIVCDKASQSCPRIWPGTLTRTYLPFDGPATFEGTYDQRLAVFRRVRDEIGTAMKLWKPEFPKR